MSGKWELLGSGGDRPGVRWNLFIQADDPTRLRVEYKRSDGDPWRHKAVTFK